MLVFGIVYQSSGTKQNTMKVFLLASLLVVANAAFLEVQDVQFQVFKDEHNKTYQNQVEEVMRFSIFSENLRAIEEHNARYEQGLELYKKGINEFSDMTQYEFTQLLGLYTKLDISATDYVMTGVEVPASVDWRKKGYVTPVKNQGQCGSCWAFAVTGATEGAYYRKHKKLVSLSEQQLVDCSTINKGCKGGYMAATFNYIKDKGLESETSYPYNARDGKCHYSSSKVVTKISSHVSIRKNERALLEAVATVGPVAVAIDASHLGSYSSGIYSDTKCKPSGLNHGVLIVGYGTEKGKNYWIVKNSWGKSWGESGYFRIERGTNRCGIAEDDSYPVIN